MSFRKVSAALISFIIIIFLGGGIYTYLENWSFIDAIYFSAVTITTLGYGDIVPVTIAGKLFTIFFSISGIAIGLYILTVLGKSFFTLELRKWGGSKKATAIRKNKPFNISKRSIGENIIWHQNEKESFNGHIVEMGLEYIKINTNKKNGKILLKKEEKTIKITSKGKVKKI